MASTAWIMPVAALNGFLAVALGAFGAHGLKKLLTPAMLEVYQTGVQYHFVHTLALLAVGVYAQHAVKSTALMVSAYAFVIGIVLFSGSLYALSTSGIRPLGIITPFGGVAFLIGWGSLFFAALKA